MKKFYIKLLCILLTLLLFIGIPVYAVPDSFNGSITGNNRPPINIGNASNDFLEFSKETFNQRENIDIDFAGYDYLGNLLTQTFEHFYSVIETGDISVFPEGLNDIDTYILLKDMQARYYYYTEINGGAYSPIIYNLIINDVKNTDNQTIVNVYAGVNFIYEESGVELCTSISNYYNVTFEGDILISLHLEAKNAEIDNYYVELDKKENDYKALYNKDLTQEQKFADLDEIFLQRNMSTDKIKSQLEESGTLFPNVEISDISSNNMVTMSAASCPYDTGRAYAYGYYFSPKNDNYIFNRCSADEDCTNFVSQCIWAGYGGIIGYNIPDIVNNHFSQNYSDIVALKSRAANNYYQVGTSEQSACWWGYDYRGSAYLIPSTNFCGVPDLWNFVTSNTGLGPRATGYNNGNRYSALTYSIKIGDIVQFRYGNSTGVYSHSAIVTQICVTGINQRTIYISQHSNDVQARTINEEVGMFSVGTQEAYVRVLSFNSANFNKYVVYK